MTDSDLIARVNDFWFGPSTDADFGKRRDHWFKSTPEFDTKIRDGFLADMGRAAAGEYDDLCNTPHGTLAVIILLLILVDLKWIVHADVPVPGKCHSNLEWIQLMDRWRTSPLHSGSGPYSYT